VLLVFGAPCQLRLLAGQEHGQTIPLADELDLQAHSSRATSQDDQMSSRNIVPSADQEVLVAKRSII